jgi:hypothetical protein
LCTERETVIGFGDVTTVTADSDSVTDTVDIDCLSVVYWGETVIGFGDVTTVTADSDSVTDTVDTD